MPQTPPTYSHMTSLSNDFITTYLVNKYGFHNVVWTIIWMQRDEIRAYLYERNELNKINHPDDNRPNSKSGLRKAFIDFTKEYPNQGVNENSNLVTEDYPNSYGYVLQSDNTNTVDLDYVWYDGEKWKGIELTTWFVPFESKDKALELVKKINRRPSWKGVNRAHGTKKIVLASKDLEVEFKMLCVNTNGGVSNDILEDGNALIFPLTIDNIELLLKGKEPSNTEFGALKDILNKL